MGGRGLSGDPKTQFPSARWYIRGISMLTGTEDMPASAPEVPASLPTKYRPSVEHCLRFDKKTLLDDLGELRSNRLGRIHLSLRGPQHPPIATDSR